jgi:hypothetical protein
MVGKQLAGGLSLYTVAPCRVVDTWLPVAAQAFVFNATVVPPELLGFITMWPLAATLNAYDGAVTNNMAIVPTTTGSVSVFLPAATHLVLDLFGYFAP